MGTAIHNYSHSYSSEHHVPLWAKFIHWCEGQQENSLAWLAASLLIHGCIFVPMTVVSIAMSGNNFVLVAVALGAMILSITVNLATIPTKITLPVFFFTLIVDVIIIIACLVHGLDISSLFKR